MDLMQERVNFPGILSGQGHEANCTVWATKVFLGSDFTYTNYSIEDVSKTLPVGEYQLSANEQVITVLHCNGHWISDLPDAFRRLGYVW